MEDITKSTYFKNIVIFTFIIITNTKCKMQQQNDKSKDTITDLQNDSIISFNQSKRWNEAYINSQITKDTIYSKLNNQKEILSAFDDNKTFTKRTSDVIYFTTDTEKINLKDNYSKKMNNCRANYFFNSDTLTIKIGISGGLSGWGFTIFYKDKKYYTQPYCFTDIDDSEFESSYYIVYQELTLNKVDYKVGDSLYGKINFKSIEITKDKKRFEHFGNGYFRTKVQKV